MDVMDKLNLLNPTEIPPRPELSVKTGKKAYWLAAASVLTVVCVLSFFQLAPAKQQTVIIDSSLISPNTLWHQKTLIYTETRKK